jgi:hypothetical protein
MFALGCVQAQTCHTGRCPTGVATQDARRQRALVVPSKAERVQRFHDNTLKALKELVQAAGLAHPGEITAAHVVRRVAEHDVRLLSTLLPSVEPGALLDGRVPPQRVFELYWPLADGASFAVAPRRERGVVAGVPA